MSAQPEFELPDYNPDEDWEADAKTPVVPSITMAELMEELRNRSDETVHSPGIPTATSDRPTKPIRPSALRLARL